MKKAENKTIKIHYGNNSSTKLIKLPSGMFIVKTKTEYKETANTFEKHQEKDARELFDLLTNINY